jgi:hypothetical protein
MIKIFDEFNTKIRYLMKAESDAEVARNLNMQPSSYQTKKKNNKIPYEEVLKWCKDKCVDANWLFNLKEIDK